MAYVNLPPNLQDMFNNLQDQINKLVSGPNAAASSADAAYSVATQAQIEAINAQVAANQAAAQAVIAQSQATIASTQATQAQTSANGKNTNHYSTSTPGTTANIAGDLWFQYGTTAPYINKVVAQFVGLGGTSWQTMPITGLVVTNIDAGSITTGTLSAIQISAGSGANSFNVSSTGVMSAQGVYVKGAIVADSGTFNGTINATAGAFGTISGGALLSGWSIGASGLTGVGSATITGGTINGSALSIGSGFNVTSSGVMTATSGTIGGWSISGSNYISYGTTFLYGNYAGSSYCLVDSSRGISIRGLLDIGTSQLTTLTVSSNTTLSGTLTVGSGSTFAQYLVLAYGSTTQTTAAPNCYISTTGQILKSSTTSSERFKENITNIVNVPELDPKLLLQIPVKAFNYIDGHITESDDRIGQMLPGLIAEDVDAIYPIAADYADGEIETWNERFIIPGLLALIQDQEKRITKLEGK